MSALILAMALLATALTPVLCAALYLSVQLACRQLPPPRSTPADSSFTRAVVSVLLWFLIACVAVSVYAEIGWVAACFAVAACVSLPFVNGGSSARGGSVALFALEVIDEPLSISFLYGMLPLLCLLPLLLAGPGAFVHCFLWGHLCWDSARNGSLPNALAACAAVALVINSFDGFSHFDKAPLLGTLAALPAGKALFRLFRMNRTAFFVGVLFTSLVSKSMRLFCASAAGTAVSIACTTATSLAILAQKSGLSALPGALVTLAVAATASLPVASVGDTCHLQLTDASSEAVCSTGALGDDPTLSRLQYPPYPR